MTQDIWEPTARRPRVAWSVVGVLGELLITAGVLLLLFVAYQLWWTNVEAHRSANDSRTELQRQWAAPVEAQPPLDGATRPGSAFALAYIPALRESVWGTPVLQGVDRASLAGGLGHYPETALPGAVGNFALAGHRATNGEPLRDVDRITAGDEVIVETRSEWLVYTLRRDRIVAPDDVWVIDPVPGEPDAVPTQELITLTTCNPRWASSQRWVWWGELTSRTDKDQGPPPAALESR